VYDDSSTAELPGDRQTGTAGAPRPNSQLLANWWSSKQAVLSVGSGTWRTALTRTGWNGSKTGQQKPLAVIENRPKLGIVHGCSSTQIEFKDLLRFR
jgi:hypothetical protein